MKLKFATLALVLGTGLAASAQGTFVYDQQSTGSTEGAPVNLNQTPFGQSFTPGLDSIDFVQFYLADGNTPGTVAINLRAGSITGQVLGTTSSTTLTANSTGFWDFLFSSTISLTPGTKYYLEPVVVGGGFVVTYGTFPGTQYTGGDAIYDGTVQTGSDFDFREGVIANVPEPSSVALLLIGGILYWHRRQRRMT